MSVIFSVEDAKNAAKRLLQLSDADIVSLGEVVSAGGASKSVFKIGDRYSLRMLRRDRDDSLLVATKAVSDLGLTPELVAGDSTAIVQKWAADVGALPADWAHELNYCRKVGALCAKLHSIALDAGATEKPKARLADLKALVETLRPKLAPEASKIFELGLAIAAEIDADSNATPSSSSLVWTHGDLHYDNLLMNKHTNELLVVDLELNGPRPRATDLAYCLFMSGLKNPSAAPKEDGRRALASSYLGGVDVTSAAVDALLWDVERATPSQAIWLYFLLLPLFPWSEQIDAWLSSALALVREAGKVLKRCATDAVLKQRVTNLGLLAVAREAK